MIFRTAKKQYDELNYRWSRGRDRFDADLQHKSVEARQEYEAKHEEFRKFRQDLKKKIVDLDVSSDNAWEDLKDGAENSWKEMTKAFDKAISHFKK